MSFPSMIRQARSSLAITGFAALVLATGFSALAPKPVSVTVTEAPRLPMAALFTDSVAPVTLAQMDLLKPIPLQVSFAEEPVADVTPSLMLDTPDTPAAVPQIETSAMIRAAARDNQRVSDAQGMCLAEAVYFEARGESLDGQLAVAQVILNRVKDKRFASSICGVVQERSPAPGRACQFSFVCDARSDVPTPSRAWDMAQAVAVVALSEETPDISDGALFFHTVHVSPRWRSRMQYTRTVGTHLFYR